MRVFDLYNFEYIESAIEQYKIMTSIFQSIYQLIMSFILIMANRIGLTDFEHIAIDYFFVFFDEECPPKVIFSMQIFLCFLN
ncbi:hypothetical protein SAMN05216439_1357 [Methanobrevibacter gottschalkii]|uniref:Uncharacterized protein n=1 Tax=Methanobrevibacter gottschalkii TaxID=190974 RepID=A0A1H7J7U3_9EURY|nr:hypothetical protein SAMN05216439_1357 [Methanobrevibacter gottschalkii]